MKKNDFIVEFRHENKSAAFETGAGGKVAATAKGECVGAGKGINNQTRKYVPKRLFFLLWLWLLIRI